MKTSALGLTQTRCDTAQAKDFAYYGLPSNATISLTGNGAFLHPAGGFRTTMIGNFDFHYDESLTHLTAATTRYPGRRCRSRRVRIHRPRMPGWLRQRIYFDNRCEVQCKIREAPQWIRLMRCGRNSLRLTGSGKRVTLSPLAYCGDRNGHQRCQKWLAIVGVRSHLLA